MSGKARSATASLTAALLFAWIARVALAPAAPPADLSIRAAVHGLASPALTVLMKALTGVGGGWFLWVFGALVALGLALAGRRRDAAGFAAVVLGANLLNEGLKLLFHRARPESFFGFEAPSTYSFPSGHAFVALCFYLALAELFTPPARRAAARWCALALGFAIGFSRVYLGVHYPTDVAAGWAGAAAWLGAVEWLRRRA